MRENRVDFQSTARRVSYQETTAGSLEISREDTPGGCLWRFSFGNAVQAESIKCRDHSRDGAFINHVMEAVKFYGAVFCEALRFRWKYSVNCAST